jgi:nucleotide sugar dehydrogenase
VFTRDLTTEAGFDRLQERVQDASRAGTTRVVVLGLGFVGTAVAANLARCERDGRRSFFVIGLERDDSPGRAKVERVARGLAPTWADDPSLAEVYVQVCAEPRSLVATLDPRAISLADVIVVCINLDVEREPGQTEVVVVPTEAFAESMRRVGRHMRADALLTIESTVPVGMCEREILPALLAGRRAQGFDDEFQPPRLAYCYERVMPGPGFLDSVNRYWRAYAGIDEESADRAEAFLSQFVDTAAHPLWRHKSIRAAELAKLLENAYRAAGIAFIDEWAKLGERTGVDMCDVIDSIRVRKGTHDNMMRPGLGVGGYCLTKDALLAAWGARELLGVDAAMPFSSLAILTNERMPQRAVEIVAAHCDGRLDGRRIVLLGITYRPEVADTRNSPAEVVARALQARGARLRFHDPLMEHWPELPELGARGELRSILEGADAVVVCLPDARYAALLCGSRVEQLAPGAIVVDPWNAVAPDGAAELARRGISLHVFGRGDLPRPRRNGEQDCRPATW